MSRRVSDPMPPAEVAKLGAAARHSTDTYIRSIVNRAPTLTLEQRAKLAVLLLTAPGGDS